jgi:hypothetical protein
MYATVSLEKIMFKYLAASLAIAASIIVATLTTARADSCQTTCSQFGNMTSCQTNRY